MRTNFSNSNSGIILSTVQREFCVCEVKWKCFIMKKVFFFSVELMLLLLFSEHEFICPFFLYILLLTLFTLWTNWCFYWCYKHRQHGNLFSFLFIVSHVTQRRDKEEEEKKTAAKKTFFRRTFESNEIHPDAKIRRNESRKLNVHMKIKKQQQKNENTFMMMGKRCCCVLLVCKQNVLQ